MTLKVKCPTCGREVVYDRLNPYRPFCCERCRLIDLGAWASGEYVIGARPVEADDEILITPEDLSRGKLPEPHQR